MTDTPLPKHKFWQIHLSTAVVMMFVAAGMLAINFIHRPITDLAEAHNPHMGPGIDYVTKQGWPIGFFWHYDGKGQRGTVSDLEALILDIPVGMGVICGAAWFCEYLIRRRSKP